MFRILIAAALVVASSSAFANDALKGRWTGTVGPASVTLTITDAKNGVLTGTIVTSGGGNTTVSGAAPSAANGQGTFQGNTVTINGAGGTWAMQLSGNRLTGTRTPTQSRAGRTQEISLTKQ